MRNLYEKINNILKNVDFNAIWEGFSVFPFALYNEHKVFLENETIPMNERFVGNTSIEYNGEFLAIWQTLDPESEDAEILASNIVHEMFHAFQNQKGDTRYTNDLVALDYPDNYDNDQIKFMENRLLAKAFITENTEEKKLMITQFMSMRKYRESLIGEIIKTEYKTETIEGLAEYAGLSALKQISERKYLETVKKYTGFLQTPNDLFFKRRLISYYSGSIFCLVAKQADLSLWHEIGKSIETVFEALSSNVSAIAPSKDDYIDELEEKRKSYIQGKENQFSKFYSQPHHEITGNFQICGYDPMNMIKIDNRLLCSHFIMLQNMTTLEKKFIKGPIIVSLKSGSVNEADAYLLPSGVI